MTPCWELADEAATAALAARLAGALDEGLVVYLHGELGAGKTSFARALLTALGAGERIKSPTYSLVESYRVQGRPAWHLDLYRIADPGELEWLGLDALSDPTALVLVEWPERGAGALPQADLVIHLGYAGTGRVARLEARTPRGVRVATRLA
ncbi:tRNA (adenosine(37)-N6)-threonylcarbamoyltransferase complex ATPase subunit type 1 TsaE [Dyella sedimenti]|uniref:tRNA (adenosine(37)-N6)-threonylcarbamoyltransferase complex ATPase subunit type 1 TsaE n=1 Tax=Dyella sedimenti TaxID=2919947 RepID=UPI001FAB1FFD|nr:tRNA (adenosine(37)-N6)-threonylcarbamoyltransferase complex ATPase subunit type 1 TsaE [Dyella sedimenti]